jgi:hypothetical protein
MLVPAARPVLTQTCAGCERNLDTHVGVNLSFLGAVRAEQRARVGIGDDGDHAATCASKGDTIPTRSKRCIVRCDARGRSLRLKTWHDEVIVTDKPVLWANEQAEGLADPGNGINSNALLHPSSRWASAVVYTTGRAAPFRLKFAGLPR